MIEDGLTDGDDILKDRLTTLKIERDKSKAALDRARSGSAATLSFDPKVVERFGRLMRHNITTGAIPFREAYIQSVVDRIEIDDNSHTHRRRHGDARAGHCRRCKQLGRGSQFVPKWRASRNKPANTYVIELAM